MGKSSPIFCIIYFFNVYLGLLERGGKKKSEQGKCIPGHPLPDGFRTLLLFFTTNSQMLVNMLENISLSNSKQS